MLAKVLPEGKSKELPRRLQRFPPLCKTYSMGSALDGLYQRQGKALTNFERTLAAPQSDLARETLKAPYIFDFLTLDKDYRERELETGLLWFNKLRGFQAS